MKLVKLSDSILKYMATEYRNTQKNIFEFSDIQSAFPDQDESLIKDSLCLLEKDGLVNIFFADNIPYTIGILIGAIRDCEEDTLLKKGYSLIKEIRSLLP